MLLYFCFHSLHIQFHDALALSLSLSQYSTGEYCRYAMTLQALVQTGVDSNQWININMSRCQMFVQISFVWIGFRTANMMTNKRLIFGMNAFVVAQKVATGEGLVAARCIAFVTLHIFEYLSWDRIWRVELLMGSQLILVIVRSLTLIAFMQSFGSVGMLPLHTINNSVVMSVGHCFNDGWAVVDDSFDGIHYVYRRRLVWFAFDGHKISCHSRWASIAMATVCSVRQFVAMLGGLCCVCSATTRILAYIYAMFSSSMPLENALEHECLTAETARETTAARILNVMTPCACFARVYSSAESAWVCPFGTLFRWMCRRCSPTNISHVLSQRSRIHQCRFTYEAFVSPFFGFLCQFDDIAGGVHSQSQLIHTVSIPHFQIGIFVTQNSKIIFQTGQSPVQFNILS